MELICGICGQALNASKSSAHTRMHTNAGKTATYTRRDGTPWTPKARAYAHLKPNRHGLFDCPNSGCDHTGKKGFKDKMQLGKHRHFSHGVPSLKRQRLAQNKAAGAHAPTLSANGSPAPIVHRNPQGRFDCLSSECHRRGQMGFTYTSNVSRHMRESHGITYIGKIKEGDQSSAQPIASPADTPPVHVPYARRPTIEGLIAEVHAQAPSAQENFAHCPRCGCNLSVLHVVMAQEWQNMEPTQARTLLEVVRRIATQLNGGNEQ